MKSAQMMMGLLMKRDKLVEMFDGEVTKIEVKEIWLLCISREIPCNFLSFN